MRLLIQIIVPRDQWYGSVARGSGDRSFDRSSAARRRVYCRTRLTSRTRPSVPGVPEFLPTLVLSTRICERPQRIGVALAPRRRWPDQRL